MSEDKKEIKYDEKQYQILLRCSKKKGEGKYREWDDEYNYGDKINLEGADLKGAHLEGTALDSANLKSAELIGAEIINADLRGANLEGANLRDVNLKGADLNGIYIGKYIDKNDEINFTNFENALFGDAILSINKICETN